MIKVLDFCPRNRYWGHNFELMNKLDEDGWRWRLAVWYEKMPEIGDFILMGLNYDDIRVAIIEKVEECGNPSDMYFLDINMKGAVKKYNEALEAGV